MFNINDTSKEDDSQLTKAIVERASADICEESKPDWIIKPLIFDKGYGDEETGVIAPILSTLSFRTISDSNLEILESGAFSNELNKRLKLDALSDLNEGLVNNVMFTMFNVIAESSILSVNSWWDAMSNKYFGFITDDFYTDTPALAFYRLLMNNPFGEKSKFVIALEERLTKFLKVSLEFNSMDNLMYKDPEEAMAKGLYYKDYHTYLENTAINITNMIGIAIIDCITRYLFNNVSMFKYNNYDFPVGSFMYNIWNSSDFIKDLSTKNVSFYNFVQISIEHILEDSLYDLIQNYINPSVKYTLENSTNSFFYMYQDISNNQIK